MESVNLDIDEALQRREAIKTITTLGARFAAATLPFAFTAIAQKAKAQMIDDQSVIDALRFALRLEYLMAAFYRRGLSAGALGIQTAERAQINTMINNLNGHADFLSKTLAQNTVTKPADTSYDLTGGGSFAGVLSNYDTYLAVAQVLEDTAVRAYKGLMTAFIGQQVYLTAGLNIHSVRARHAAAVRYLRFSIRGKADAKPWVSGDAGVYNDTGLPAADGFYQRENITQQSGFSISGTDTVAIEAFDEPLTVAEAAALLAGFRL